MTVKNKERGLNIIIALIVSFSGVFMAFKLNNNAEHDAELRQSIECRAKKTYVDQQNKAQDESLNKRLQERDKMNTVILEELSYIKHRVDRIPTK